MAPTKETKTDAKADVGRFDPLQPCPGCMEPVHMYLPPDRAIAGSVGYPALMLHYEEKHPRLTPPAAPLVDAVEVDESTGLVKKTGKKVPDTWNPEPPDPKDWMPKDMEAEKRRRPQPAGVWPPIRELETPS